MEHWSDVTGNTNPNRQPISLGKTGVAVVIRAGQAKKENENLIATIEHFLGHLDIPLKHKFAVEGISTEDDLKNNPSILEKTAAFSEEVCSEICKCR